jgi:hypothetical protein
MPAGVPQSLSGLGLDRSALLGSGLQQHSINSLYRSLAARAGAKQVAGPQVLHTLHRTMQVPSSQEPSTIAVTAIAVAGSAGVMASCACCSYQVAFSLFVHQFKRCI